MYAGSACVDMVISMDIHGKSVDMDGRFHGGLSTASLYELHNATSKTLFLSILILTYMISISITRYKFLSFVMHLPVTGFWFYRIFVLLLHVLV